MTDRLLYTPVERLALRPGEFADAVGISRSKAYAVLAANPQIVIRIGNSIRVPIDKLQKWLAEQSQQAEAGR